MMLRPQRRVAMTFRLWLALFGLMAFGCGSRSTLPTEPDCIDDCKGPDCVVWYHVGVGQTSARGVALDQSYVYWTDGQPGQEQGVFKASRCDGSTTTIATGQRFPWSLAVDGDTLFWGNIGVEPSVDDGSLMRSGLDGEGTMVLAEQGVSALAVDDDHVYWGGSRGRLHRTPRGGGQTTELPLGHGLGSVRDLALDEANVYVTYGNGTVGRMSKAGDSFTVLADAQVDPRELAVDDAAVYWLDVGSGDNMYRDAAVRSVAKDGGAVVSLATSQDGLTGAIAIDDDYVYFVSNHLSRVPKRGGEPISLARAQYLAYGIAVDAAGIYWTASDVRKLTSQP